MSVHISVYIMYTVCSRRYTGRYVEGVYTEFYSRGRVPSSSGHMPVYSMYMGRIMGNSECGVEGMCTDLMLYNFKNTIFIDFDPAIFN